MKTKRRSKGEVFRPVTKVLKERKGVPTKISFNGNEYSLLHKDHANGNKNQVKK